MIPEIFIENWRKTVPWQMTEQIEQDLMISRALVDLYNDPHVKDALVFRGGTALNKLFINPPARYSEDIDFVQVRPEPIGKVIDAIRFCLDDWLGEPKPTRAEVVFEERLVEDDPARWGSSWRAGAGEYRAGGTGARDGLRELRREVAVELSLDGRRAGRHREAACADAEHRR